METHERVSVQINTANNEWINKHMLDCSNPNTSYIMSKYVMSCWHEKPDEFRKEKDKGATPDLVRDFQMNQPT